MKIKSFIIAATATAMMQSCLSDSTEVITQDLTPYMFSYVTDLSTNSTTTYQGSTYTLATDRDAATMTFKIEQLKVAEGKYINVSVADQKFSVTNNGGSQVELPSYISVVNGISHVVTDYSFTTWTRFYGAQTFPMVLCSFTVDGIYRAQLVFTPGYYWGPTTVTGPSGKDFINKSMSTFYGIQLDPQKNTARVAIQGATFNEHMPAQNMLLNDIPYTMSQSSYTAQAQEITPTIGGVPYPAYKITDFKWTGYYNGLQTVEFTVNVDNPAMQGSFNVKATLDVMPTSDME